MRLRSHLRSIACAMTFAAVAGAASTSEIPVFHYDIRAEHWLAANGQFDMAAAVRRFSTDHDSLLEYYNTRLSTEKSEALVTFDKTWLSVLDRVPFEKLDGGGRIDWLLLRAQVRDDLDHQQLRQRDAQEMGPLVPFAPRIESLDDKLRHFEFIDGKDAAAAVSGIADQITTLTADVNAGRLKATPTVGHRASDAVRSLTRTLTRWHDFYTGYDPSFTWWTAEPWKRANTALAAYASLLDEKIAGAKDKDTIVGDPVGKEAIEASLENNFIAYTPEELISHARQELSWCQDEMIRSSRAMGYGDDWHKALEQVKNDYVKPGQQPATVRDLENEALAFIQKRDLITVPPETLHLWRMEMMSVERQRINPFFTGGEVLSVSYPTDTMTEAQKLMSMRGNNVHYARATVFHETIPGHFLEEYMEQRYHPWRAAFESPFWNEGWAFYWETLLWDLDFARTPEDRMGMLFWRMHRAARVIFSLSFHLGKMTAPEAVNFLITQVGHEPENAAAEVRRSFETDEYGPLYQAAYEIGAMQFRALHAGFVDSGKMSNREFHDAILKLGPMPVEMIRASLLKQELPKDFKAHWRFFDEVARPATAISEKGEK